MDRLITLAAVCALLFALTPVTSFAQDDDQSPPTIAMTVAQCDRTMLGDLFEHDRERSLPILQELVDEGMIWSGGVMAHWWGDEWNVVNVLMASDEAAAMAANDEIGRRYGERYPDDSMWIEVCPRHRDTFYQGIVGTQGGSDEEDNGDGSAIAVSYFECDYSRMGEIAAEDREDVGVFQELVDEGAMNFWGSAAHTWGNEWNYLVFQGADDIPALLEGINEAGDRFQELDPDGDTVVNEACTAHKDNIYAQVYWTTDPE